MRRKDEFWFMRTASFATGSDLPTPSLIQIAELESVDRARWWEMKPCYAAPEISAHATATGG